MSKESTVFATANIGGILLYAYLYWEIVQTIHREQRPGADFQDGLAFLTTAFPVLVVFVTADLIWVAVMTNQHRRHKDSKWPLLFGIFALIAWSAAVLGLRQVS
jgi:hypothetical protein